MPVKWLIAAAILVLGCARVLPDLFPTSCQPGHQSRDQSHRVHGTADCYVCTDSPAGTTDAANHYRCLDDRCNECETPIVPFEPSDPLHPLEARASDGGAR